MPQLSDLINRRAGKKFVKKEYRSYNLNGANDEAELTKVIVDTLNSEKNSDFTLKVSQSYTKCNKEDLEIKDNDKGNIKVTNLTKDNDKDNIKVTNVRGKDNNIDNNIDNNKGNKDSIILLTNSIRKLIGLQQKIFFYIIDLCSSRGEMQTNPILTNDLAKTANCSNGSVKTSLIRLIKKNLLLRKKGKNARGGHIILGITENIQTAALHAQSFNYIGNNISNTLDNNEYTSSSYNINTTTTRVEQLLPEDWKAINIEPLQKHGFSFTQLKQLHALNITSPEIVQESISHFAFGLKNNPKFKTYRDPLNVLMGVLRKGEVWCEKDYKSPKELAMEKIIERKRAEQKRIKQLEEQLFSTALKEWKETKSEAELDKLIPPGTIPPRSVKISIYFKENIWPTVKSDYSS